MVIWAGYCNCPRAEVHEFNFVPSTRFFRSIECRKSPCVGAEIELFLDGAECRETATNHVWREISPTMRHLLYCKEDSTIGNGVEFVTHPFTKKFLRENKTDFQQFFSIATGVGFEARPCCGLHLSLSMSDFSPSHLYRFLRLMYGFPQFWLQVSGRDRQRFLDWCNLFRYGDGSGVHPERQIVRWAKRRRSSRHGISLSRNRAEVRIWNGVDTFAGLRSAVDITHEAFKYSQITPVEQISPDGFTNFSEVL